MFFVTLPDLRFTVGIPNAKHLLSIPDQMLFSFMNAEADKLKTESGNYILTTPNSYLLTDATRRLGGNRFTVEIPND